MNTNQGKSLSNQCALGKTNLELNKTTTGQHTTTRLILITYSK